MLEHEINLKNLEENGVRLIRSMIPKEVISRIETWYSSENFAKEGYQSQNEKNKYIMRKARRLFWNDLQFWKEVILESGIEALLRKRFTNPTIIYHALFNKDSGGSAVGLHQDQFLWDYEYPDSVNLWFNLDLATELNGCIQVYPESHRLGQIVHELNDGFHDCINPEHLKELNLPEPIFMEMEPGDVLLWDRYMVHGSRANRSPFKRRAIVMVIVEREAIKVDTIDFYEL